MPRHTPSSGKSQGLSRCVEKMHGAGIPAWWEPLFERCSNRSIFLSPEWLRTWLEVYGGDFTGHWIHWEVDGAVVGGCLLTKRTVWRYFFRQRILSFNATGIAKQRTPLAEFNDLPFVSGHEEQILLDLADFLLQRGWDRLSLSGYEDSALLARVAALLPAYKIERDSRPAPYVDLTGFKETTVESALSGRYRSQMRKCREIYEQTLGAVALTRAETAQQAQAYFDELAQLHNDRWQKKGDEGSFQTPSVVQFHQRIIDRLWDKNAVDLLRIRAGETVVGCIYNFIDRGKVYFFQSGYSYDNNPNIRPGLLSQLMAIEDYRARDFVEYDFLAGDARYKRMFAKQHRVLHWTAVYRKSIWNRLFFFAKHIKSRLSARRTT
ncbi:MAG: GNAT family N-acetyltransferase [Rudaea sp.]